MTATPTPDDGAALDSCPFCDGKAEIKTLEHAYWNRCIECQRCYCKTGEYNDKLHSEAMVMAWNRRTRSPAPVSGEAWEWTVDGRTLRVNGVAIGAAVNEEHALNIAHVHNVLARQHCAGAGRG